MGDGCHAEGGAQELFDSFVSASTCRAALRSFGQLCEHLQLDRAAAARPLYRPLKRRLNYWKANALWTKLDRRAAQHEALRARVCSGTTCVVIGAGPCGLRAAVELSFMGARVVLLEKRDSFSRNNVLHLWPFTIHDLRGLGAKKFYGKFCAGSIDHISIRQLQLVLLKVALLLGVEVHVNVEFQRLLEPPEDQQRRKVGWRMEVKPKSHPVSQLEFDVVIGADGRRNTLPGFRRKEFRGKLAIAVTANFKNRNTSAEAKVEEISGVAFIFNQRFFQELRQDTGIDLENIVYYKDDTHYFVMTAKKQSLLEKGVILQDFADTEQLLSPVNVDQKALQAYARKAADFSTNHQLPSLDFAMNHYGQPDVAMFDFTCMSASENAAMVRQRHGHQLLVTLVGDSLLEPFWPMGTGVARGFLAALDAAWMIRSWAQGGAPLDVLAERESLYRLLPQTTPENMQKNIALFSVDPATRYLNVSPLSVTPAQVRHLVDTGEKAGPNTGSSDIIRLASPRLGGEESFARSNQLLAWCQEQTRGYSGVAVSDLTTSWKSGLALCALIHRHRPDLIDFGSLDAAAAEENTRLGFDVAELEFGISPLMTVEEMLTVAEPDSLSMVMYLSQFYQLFRDSAPPAGGLGQSADLRSALVAPASLLSRLGASPTRKRTPQEPNDALSKRRRSVQLAAAPLQSCDLNGDVDDQPAEEASVGGTGQSRVRQMANRLQAKLDESSCGTSPAAASRQQQGELLSSQPVQQPGAPSSWKPNKRTLQQQQMSFRFREKIKHQNQDQVGGGSSDVCFFCQNRVYVMERLSAEGLFFHRSCFQCHACGSSLRLASYTFDQHSRRFHCLQHSECGRTAVRRRRASSDRAASQRTSIVSLGSAPPPSDSSAATRRSSAASLMAAAPERMELREEQEEQEEVSEEVLNRFNLSEDEKLQPRSSEDEDTAGGTSDDSEASCSETLPLGEDDDGEDQDESSDEGEYCPWETERRSGLWLLLEEDAEAELPATADTPAASDPASGSLQCAFTPSSLTPPHGTTLSTASFVSTPDSAPDSEGAGAPLTPAVVMETARGRGSFDDITPELPQREFLLQQERAAVLEGEESDSEGEESAGVKRRRRHRGAQSLPPQQAGGGALKQQLRGLYDATPSAEGEAGVGGARALWKTVFFGQEQKKKKRGGTLVPETLMRETANHRRVTDVTGAESDLGDSMTLLHRSSLKPGSNVLDLTDGLQRVSLKDQDQPPYVPHALAFKRSYGVQKRLPKERLAQDSDMSSCPTETVGVLVQPKELSSLSVKETLFQTGPEDQDEDLDAKLTRRVQRAARRQAKQEQLKRLHKAQTIQRQLQQVEERQRQLEERGVMVEKALRGEADYWEDSSSSPDLELHLGGLGKVENLVLMQQWFQLVQQKNSLVRYEAELIILARELELEDRQSRLQQQLRQRMAVDDHLKGAEQLEEERLILQEMLDVVERRDALVSLLEEQRLQDRQEDQDLDRLLLDGGLGLSWS